MDSNSDNRSTLRVNCSDLEDILKENRHLRDQVTELQQSLTLKEEHLRVHRRGVLQFATTDQAEALKLSLEAVTKEILAKYNINQNSK